MSDHPVDPRDDEPYGEPPKRETAHDYRDDRHPGEVHNRTCQFCPGEGGEHKLSCTRGGGQLKVPARVTLSGRPAEPGTEGLGAPAPIDPNTGMHKDYWVLSDEERAKGFVEPVRNKYRHVGIAGPVYPLRDLTTEEIERFGQFFYHQFEVYPEDHASGAIGRYWTKEQLDAVGKGCRTVTAMGAKLAETYAREPNFYGSTFCAGCREHFRVGDTGEFVWDNTSIRVGCRTPKKSELGAATTLPAPPENWEPTVKVLSPLKDISELRARRAEAEGTYRHHRIKKVTIILELENVNPKEGVPLVIDTIEGTELFMNLDMRSGHEVEEQPDGSKKYKSTRELDYNLEIYRRKV